MSLIEHFNQTIKHLQEEIEAKDKEIEELVDFIRYTKYQDPQGLKTRDYILAKHSAKNSKKEKK